MRGIEAKLLQAFIEVASTRSFTMAAVNLSISRPALSLQLSKLEQQLEFMLFIRTTGSGSLTEEGERLLPLAMRVVADHELLSREIYRMRGRSGALRIGVALHTSRWSMRDRLLDDFAAAHEAVQLHVETGLQKNMLVALESGKMDALLFGGLPTSRADYERRLAQRRRSEGLYPEDLSTVVIDSVLLELLAPAESSWRNFPGSMPRPCAGSRSACRLRSTARRCTGALPSSWSSPAARPRYCRITTPIRSISSAIDDACPSCG